MSRVEEKRGKVIGLNGHWGEKEAIIGTIVMVGTTHEEIERWRDAHYLCQ